MRTAPIVAALLVAACAKSPDSIAPAYVSDVPYLGWSCDQLGQESARLSAALATASKQQEDARTNDTVGVIFLGLPVSTLSGDNVAPEIARLKGEQNAVRQASMKNNCGAAAPAAPAVAPAPAAPTAAAGDNAPRRIVSTSDNKSGDVAAQAERLCAAEGKIGQVLGWQCLDAACGAKAHRYVCR